MIKIILLILIFSSSCDDPTVEGCTSPSACNWNPRATKSDGTCIQPLFCDNWCSENIDDTPPEAGESYQWNDEGRDCEGICRGEALVDECGICISPHGENNNIPPEQSPLWNITCIDCDGIPNGTSAPDCNNDCGGTATVDECGVCSGGNTSVQPNGDKDCHGDCNGTAEIDDCGQCTGGETGAETNFLKDECGICNGDGYANGPLNDGINACIGSDDCNNMDCTGVCNPNISTSSYLNYTESQFCDINCGSECGWKPFPGCTELETINNLIPSCISDDLIADCYIYGAELDNCLDCSGGSSENIACTQDCDLIWGGTTEEDCAGECGGSAVLDECNVCNGAGNIYECGCFDIEDGKCDCEGNIEDECGECGGTGPDAGYDCDENCIIEVDCAGECGGDTIYDDCGICNGDGYTLICPETENCTNMDCAGTCIGQPGFGIGLDCAGQCGGSALYDCDGVCCAGTTGTICAQTDECGDCNNDSSDDCVPDCSDSENECDGTWNDAQCWGGTASIDICLTCSGGGTGNTPDEGPTEDGLYSCSDITLLVAAGVCTDSDDCISNTCPTLLWEFKDDDGNGIDDEDCKLEEHDCEYKQLYGFDFEACGENSVPSYVEGFSITKLNLRENSFNNFPENIINIATLDTVDLQFNTIGNIPNSICTLTANPCIVDIRNNVIFDCSQIPDCQNAGELICE